MSNLAEICRQRRVEAINRVNSVNRNVFSDTAGIRSTRLANRAS